MKFLADAAPGLLVESLTSLGHDVFWAYTVPRTPDLELIEKVARERRVVITFDKDFGELVFKRGHSDGARARTTSPFDKHSARPGDAAFNAIPEHYLWNSR